MKKSLFLILFVFLLCFLCVGCSVKEDNVNSTTTTTESNNEPFSTSEFVSDKETENKTESQMSENSNSQTGIDDSTTTTKKNQNTDKLSDEDIERIKNTNATVYFVDNPDNPHIVAVSEKYGAKKENTVALVKVNAEFPSATLFEFSGKRDENGELIMTYQELKYMYEINEEDNSILKISKNGKDDDGVSFVEAKIFLTMAKSYIIPELPNLKANKRLPE